MRLIQSSHSPDLRRDGGPAPDLVPGSDTTEALKWALQNHGGANGAIIMPYANISSPTRFDHIYWRFDRLFLPSSIIESEDAESLIPARRDLAAGDLSRPPS